MCDWMRKRKARKMLALDAEHRELIAELESVFLRNNGYFENEYWEKKRKRRKMIREICDLLSLAAFFILAILVFWLGIHV